VQIESLTIVGDLVKKHAASIIGIKTYIETLTSRLALKRRRRLLKNRLPERFNMFRFQFKFNNNRKNGRLLSDSDGDDQLGKRRFNSAHCSEFRNRADSRLSSRKSLALSSISSAAQTALSRSLPLITGP